MALSYDPEYNPDFKRGLPLTQSELPTEAVIKKRTPRFPKAQEFMDMAGVDSSSVISASIDINGCEQIVIGPDGRYLTTQDRDGEDCLVLRYRPWPTMAVGLHILDLLFQEGWVQGT